jgi:hypothetical protein
VQASDFLTSGYFLQAIWGRGLAQWGGGTGLY